MTELTALGLAAAAGALLGAFFFAGLWWTVRNGITASRPAIWFLASLLLRTGVVLVGFHLVADGRAGRLLALLAGFLAARFLITRRMGPPVRNGGLKSDEAPHAP